MYNIYIYIYIYIYIIHIYLYIYINVYIYICIYIKNIHKKQFLERLKLDLLWFGEVLWKQTALKYCIRIEIRWNRNNASLGSSVAIAPFRKEFQSLEVYWAESLYGQCDENVGLHDCVVYVIFPWSCSFSDIASCHARKDKVCGSKHDHHLDIPCEAFATLRRG